MSDQCIQVCIDIGIQWGSKDSCRSLHSSMGCSLVYLIMQQKCWLGKTKTKLQSSEPRTYTCCYRWQTYKRRSNCGNRTSCCQYIDRQNNDRRLSLQERQSRHNPSLCREPHHMRYRPQFHPSDMLGSLCTCADLQSIPPHNRHLWFFDYP